MTSVGIMVSLAATYHWPLHQLDIKSVFLNDILAEKVYMKQSPGFVAQRECVKVCRLKKSLYSLKQSPRAWFEHFASVIQEFDLCRAKKDHSVF